jgi:hypothetical protein
MLTDLWLAAAHQTATPPEKLTVNCAPETPLAIGDSVQLVRAFANLLRNANEAEASRITIETFPSENAGFVTTRISDNGIGIPAEMHDKIWASFFTTKGETHKGMGLAACLHIISQLGGSIRVESEAEKDTAFIIELPAAEAQPALTLDNAPSNVSLIAPEGKWADFIRTTLENSACTVNKIPDPATDLLLLDEILAAQTLPSLGKLSGKTLILSAAPRVEKITEYLQAGIKDVVLKPYTATELKEILAQFSA